MHEEWDDDEEINIHTHTAHRVSLCNNERDHIFERIKPEERWKKKLNYKQMNLMQADETKEKSISNSSIKKCGTFSIKKTHYTYFGRTKEWLPYL